jgi:hypothetical protein
MPVPRLLAAALKTFLRARLAAILVAAEAGVMQEECRLAVKVMADEFHQ